MLQTVRAQKVDEKMGHLSSFHVSFLSYDLLNCLKKLILRFYAALSKKAIYI